MTLEEKIAARHAQVGVIGLGHLGLLLIIEQFHSIAGYRLEDPPCEYLSVRNS